jgi:ribosomal protein S18 acetylase RimI-like enzyme
MPLPILKSPIVATPGDLLRYASQLELAWTSHLSSETVLDCGRAFVEPKLAGVCRANRMLDASVPLGMSAPEVVEQVHRHFADTGSRCWQWVLNISAPPDWTLPLAELLVARSYRPNVWDILHLPHLPRLSPPSMADLKIIPARAAFRHFRALAEEGPIQRNKAQHVDAAMLHLDDSHYDALLALKGNLPAGYVGVLSVGDIGGIQKLFVSEQFRRQGIGTILMSRAMEICERSLFRHVLLSVHPQNEPAHRLYQKLGFVKIGQSIEYTATEL